jgi:hypothetical protein
VLGDTGDWFAALIGEDHAVLKDDVIALGNLARELSFIREMYYCRPTTNRRCYGGISAKLLVQWRLRSQTEGLLRHAV